MRLGGWGGGVKNISPLSCGSGGGGNRLDPRIALNLKEPLNLTRQDPVSSPICYGVLATLIVFSCSTPPPLDNNLTS